MFVRTTHPTGPKVCARHPQRATRAQVRRHRVPVVGSYEQHSKLVRTRVQCRRRCHVRIVYASRMPWDRAVPCGSINVRRSARLSTRACANTHTDTRVSDSFMFDLSFMLHERKHYRMLTDMCMNAYPRSAQPVTFRIIRSCIRFGTSIEMLVHIMDIISPLRSFCAQGICVRAHTELIVLFSNPGAERMTFTTATFSCHIAPRA